MTFTGPEELLLTRTVLMSNVPKNHQLYTHKKRKTISVFPPLQDTAVCISIGNVLEYFSLECTL